MRFHIFIISLLATVTCIAQKQYNVLDWKTDVTLNTFLVQRMKTQYEERGKKLDAALQSRKSLSLYAARVRKKFLQLLSPPPQQSAASPEITGIIKKEGYRIEKIIYESFPRHHVTANLYIPDGPGPFPAALLFCGHEDISKATESYQRTAILFARNGFVVFVIDPLSQSERYQLTDVKGKPLTRGGTTEHTLLNEASNLFGYSTAADELWDNVRGLDYLVTRKEVDSSRIGCLGNSGGGMQTIYFAAYDNRIKVIAPCSYLANRERTLEITGPADGCAQMPGEGKMELELSDYLIAAAPKPLLVLAGRYDFIDYSGTLIAYEELKKVYTRLGQTDHLKLFTYDDGHGISKPKREAAVSWFRKWLCHDARPVTEMDWPLLTDKELSCTASGQVNAEYPDEKSIAARNLELFDSYAGQRNIFCSQKKEIVKTRIKEFLAIENDSNRINIQEAGSLSRNNIIYDKKILRKSNTIPLPLLFISPPPGEIKKIVVWLSETGKNKIADSITLIRSYLDNGYAVILADLSGTGETEDKAEMNDPKYYNREYRNAMFALHNGNPLAVQRTTDIFSIMELIARIRSLAGLPIELNVSGINCLPALCAALFSDGISKLNLLGSIQSFREILDKPVEKNWYSWVIPGVLRYFDIPDLVKWVGENKISFKEQ